MKLSQKVKMVVALLLLGFIIFQYCTLPPKPMVIHAPLQGKIVWLLPDTQLSVQHGDLMAKVLIDTVAHPEFIQQTGDTNALNHYLSKTHKDYTQLNILDSQYYYTIHAPFSGKLLPTRKAVGMPVLYNFRLFLISKDSSL